MNQAAPQNSGSTERAIAFTHEAQIHEILKEAERLKLLVLIRFSIQGTAIRGCIESLDFQAQTMIIHQISPEGFKLLKDHYDVKIEFVLLSKKLVFLSKIRGRVPFKILVGFPNRIVSIERRNNSRFRIQAPQHLKLEVPGFIHDNSRWDSPMDPLAIHLDLAHLPRNLSTINRFHIDDISLGGIALVTHHHLVTEFFVLDSTLDGLFLIPKGKTRVPVTLNVRWVKKITNMVSGEEDEKIRKTLATKLSSEKISQLPPLKETFYRIGLQFMEVPRELDSAIRNYIRQLQTSESV
jgi:c-di-GMP-binding flagellar brake protein YcgR